MASYLENFLKQFLVKKNSAEVGPLEHTHTQIPCSDSNYKIYGGTYNIPPEKMIEFYDIYKNHVFKLGKYAHLTEKQLDESSILIDVDFRYTIDIEERQHKKEHISDLVNCILEGISKIKITNNKSVEVYIFEKDNVNTLEDKTKDGIHLLINTKFDQPCKILLRDYLIKNMPMIWSDLPIQNSWNDVFDESVMKAHSNWQLFGSRKPLHLPYELKYIYSCSCNKENDWSMREKPFGNDWIYLNFNKLTARNIEDLVDMDLNPEIQNEYEMAKQKRTKKPIKKADIINLEDTLYHRRLITQLSNKEELDNWMHGYLSDIEINYTTIFEAHQYVMALPQEYWGAGSYSKWIRVGWALKNIGHKALPTWVLFSSQSDNFDWNIAELEYRWSTFNSNNKEGLTIKSIIYWCKYSNEKRYNEIYEKTISYHINLSVKSNTDYDLANVLFQLYKHDFVCVGIKDNTWYEFMFNRWIKMDEGNTLRSKISTEMFKKYAEHCKGTVNKNTHSPDTSAYKSENQIAHDGGTTGNLLKNTSKKNTIMREAREIFYDRDFFTKLNTNPYLIGCLNCVVDIKNKTSRLGKHDDYISMTTNLEYKPLKDYKNICPKIIDEINLFMSQILPNENVRNYMWEHLASCLVGTTENQDFNFYLGSGSNGKSKLVELMAKVLGEYKGVVPITLISQKRNTIGSTSSEVYELIGKRYAVIQEPTEGDVINEGIMKEITGGDPIQCRALFQNSVTFIPQFKLVVCANKLPIIKATDDGTWRRVKVIDFVSKFTDNPYKDPNFPVEDYPYQFKLYKIDERFDEWAPVMLSMLVDVAFRTQGAVSKCTEVSASSMRYRQSQDVYLDFINACLIIHDTAQPTKLKISVVNQTFKDWYSSNHSNSKNPPLKDLKDYLIKKFGAYPKDGWGRLSLNEVETDN
jgi:P4 family phage/plasmid primase-like protien